MVDYELIGKRFKELREQCGLTQGQMANYLAVDQSYISKCEKNERQFSADILEKAGYLFGCSLDYFTNVENQHSPLPVALRASTIETEDLETIAAVTRLALNLRFMEGLLEGPKS